MIPAEATCKDFGERPGCLGEPDPRYTMDFSDIGEGQIFWCSHCGPDAHAMNAALERAFATRGPEFPHQLAEEIAKGMAEMKAKIA